MIRERLISVVLAGVTSCGIVCGPARGQTQVEVLVFDSTTLTASAWDAVGELGYNRTRAFTEGGFENLLRTKTWDLVVIEIPGASLVQKTRVLAQLESHVSAGGRLLVNYNNLDEWPGLQKLLGVERAEELMISKNVTKTDPIHPSFPRNHYRSGNAVFSQMWADAGDWLWPSSEGEVAGIFVNDEPAIVVSNDGRTIVNGFDWGSYVATSLFVEEQIKYIMSCKPDLDQSTGVGVLDIFDFLAFQDLFVKQDPLANMIFDPSFDIFDFLAFQESFVNGCK